jgi:hypothetical protein
MSIFVLLYCICISIAICKQLPPLQSLCANIDPSRVNKETVK